MKEKRKSQGKGKEVDLVKQSKEIDERPQGLDIGTDEEELEESDNNDTDFESESER